MNSKEKAALHMVNDMFPSRAAVLRFLRRKLNLKLPRNTKTQEIVKLIINKGREQEFCQAVFKEIGLDIEVANFKEACNSYKAIVALGFFTVKQIIEMAEELSEKQAKWKFKRKNRMSLIQSIVRNVSIEEIEGYVQRGIRGKEIPPIQGDKSGWILGAMGLLRSTVSRKPFRIEELTKFLLRHSAYPSPYHEIKEKAGDKLVGLTLNKRDPLLKEKISQLLLVELSDEEIFEIFNQLLDGGSVKIPSIERYWNFVATPHGVFEPPYSGERNLAKLILRTFKEEDLRPRLTTNGNIKALIRQKCILDPPEKILREFFGSGPYQTKLAKKIGLVGLRRIENEKIFVQSILLKLGFSVPPELEGIVSFASKLERYLKEVKSGFPLPEGRWNAIYNFLERLLEDLVLFYASILQERKLMALEEEERESEIKGWIRKIFKLKKQFDDLTFGDLCALVREMNRFLKDHTTARRRMSKLFGRVYFVKEEHLHALDFIKGCRTELTKIHWKRRRGKKCDQVEVFETLLGLLKDWTSERGLLRTYPYLIRLKEEVTTEYGVRYYTVVNEEGRELKLKTNRWIEPEDVWFMISENERFPIDPVLLKKFW